MEPLGAVLLACVLRDNNHSSCVVTPFSVLLVLAIVVEQIT